MAGEIKFQLDRNQFMSDRDKQLKLLTEAAEQFDSGDTSKVNVLVVSILKLIGDRFGKNGKPTENSVSLLTRLNLKPQRMVDISFHADFAKQSDLHGPFIAVGILPTGATEHVPLLDGFEDFPDFYGRATTDFQTWWNKPILRDSLGNTFSRRYIIDTMRDSEIVHTDSGVPMSYGLLAYQRSLNIKTAIVGVEPADSNITNVIVRHVAHELLRTLVPGYPKKFSIASGQRANPIVNAEISSQNFAGRDVKIFNYAGVKFLTLWAKSVEMANNWMEQHQMPAAAGFAPIEFHGERVPTNYVPTGVRIAIINYYPVEVQVKQFQIGWHDSGTLAILIVVE